MTVLLELLPEVLEAFGAEASTNALVGAAVRQGAAGVARAAVESGARSLSEREITAAARRTLAVSERDYTAVKVRTLRGKIIQEADAANLRGPERTAYKAKQDYRIASERKHAKLVYAEMRDGIHNSYGNLSKNLVKSVTDSIGNGDIEGAMASVRQNVAKTIRRELSDVRTGRRTGSRIESALTGDRSEHIDAVIDKVAGGEKITSAARGVILDNISVGDVSGQDAFRIAKQIGEYNKRIMRARSAHEMQINVNNKQNPQPEELAEVDARINEAISPFGLTAVNGEFVDDAGIPVSIEDITVLIQDREIESIHSLNPKADPDVAAERLTRLPNYGGYTNRIMRSFATSFATAGIPEAYPYTTARIFEKLEKMSISQLAYIVKSGVKDGLVEWFSSDSKIIKENLDKLSRLCGLDPNELDKEERKIFKSKFDKMLKDLKDK